MKELLELCGFTSQEAQAQMPRVKSAFKKFEVTDEEIQEGKKRLRKYYDVELEGVRKALRLCMLEFLDAVQAREDGKTKIVAGFMAPSFDIIGSAANTQFKDVHVAYHNWPSQMIVGCVLDKWNQTLETAEKQWLKAGMVAHCGNVKGLLGTIALGHVPKPDLLITAGFLCETSPKTLDLFQEKYGIPVAYYDSCFDRELGSYMEDNIRCGVLAAKSMRALVNRINETIGYEINDEILTEVLDARDQFNFALAKIFNLLVASDPMPLSSTHFSIFFGLCSFPFTLERFPEAIDALNILHEELSERVRQGTGVVKKGAPRVLAVLPTHHADPRFEHLTEEVGIAIVSTDVPFALPTTDLSNEKDPYLRMTFPLSMSLCTSLSMRVSFIVENCKLMKVDGLMDRYHVGCRTVTADAFYIEKAVKEKVGIPVLTMEWESFDPRVFNYDEYRKRLEVFKSMMEK